MLNLAEFEIGQPDPFAGVPDELDFEGILILFL